ncbi:MAG TPA: monofunctional biosynthetic peptidoglycan transglycosylase [Gammaproteobacteria bacterium]|nr:monofunctional biosynthetic peptidoglycan transglycosylase [Gammaproteobacteria bacterium]
MRTILTRLFKYACLVLVLMIGISVLAVYAIRQYPPPTSAFMLRASVLAAMDGRNDYVTHYQWMDMDRLPPIAGLAMVAAEDQLFLEHHGFDVESMEEALQRNAEGHRLRGASTISQQVAKNLFLWPGRSFVRKGLEAWFTVLLEWLLPKRRILEIYLNVAQFGEGIYGVTAAAQHYFHKSPLELAPVDYALLAAVLPNPLRLRVDKPSIYVRTRQIWILGQMRHLGPGYMEKL